MPTIADKLSAYAATLKYEDVPAEVIHQAKRFIIDTLGCACGGYAGETSNIAREMAELVSSSNPATVLFSGHKTSVDMAAFANDAMIRYLDFNDGYMSKGSGHPSDSIAALLSAAEIMRGSGRDLILATVLTYEIFCRLSDAWDNKPLGIDHVTTGGIASAIGVARLFGLTRTQITEAINLTAAANVTLMQTRVGSISNWKGYAYANANRNAIFAAQLAARGITGPSPIFEGRYGFFRIVTREPFELAAFGGDGREFRIMQCHLKQFPLGNYSQTVVHAALEVRKLIDDVSDIAQVHVRTSEMALNIMADDPEKWRPRNSETADHSIPYTAGVALMYGTIDPSYFTPQYFLHDHELLALVGRIECSTTEEANRRGSKVNLCDLEVVMRSGECKSVRVEYHRGHSLNPMTDAEIEGKFRSLAAAVLPAPRVDALLKRLWTLEDVPEVSTIIQMMASDCPAR